MMIVIPYYLRKEPKRTTLAQDMKPLTKKILRVSQWLQWLHFIVWLLSMIPILNHWNRWEVEKIEKGHLIWSYEILNGQRKIGNECIFKISESLFIF